MHAHRLVPVLVLALALSGVGDAAASGGERTHAGNVVEVDAAAGHVVIEEMAPGSVTRRVAALVDAGTRAVEVVREPVEVVVGESQATRDVALTHRWVERPLDLATVRPGDFAVVELAEEPAGDRPAPAVRVAVTARAR